jgi:hypothetical protein
VASDHLAQSALQKLAEHPIALPDTRPLVTEPIIINH